jgi:YegS/Rv2252/BmrU family lipid kinase
MRIKLFCNPTAGRGRSVRMLQRVIARLASAGATVEITESTSSGHLTDLAAHASSGYDRVAVLGGDGTLHHLIRGYPLSTPLGIIPGGSGDDFAAALGIPRDLDKACDVILQGKVRHVDVAEANGVRYIGVAGLGFDSVVARHANSVRLLRGSLVYLWSIFRVLPQFSPKKITLSIDGVQRKDEVMFIVVANSPRYGGGIRIAPRAELDDRTLETYLTHRCSKATLLKTLPMAYSGKHVNSSFVEHLRGSLFVIDAEEQLELYADGEFVTTTPVEIKVAEERLAVYVP